MRLIVLLITLILVSCNGQKKAAMNEVEIEKSEASDDQLELIMQEEQGGFEADEMLIIKDSKRLKSFFSKINRTRKPGLPMPDIDFAKDMVIIQCLSEESSVASSTLSIVKETDSQKSLTLVNSSNTLLHTFF